MLVILSLLVCGDVAKYFGPDFLIFYQNKQISKINPLYDFVRNCDSGMLLFYVRAHQVFLFLKMLSEWRINFLTMFLRYLILHNLYKEILERTENDCIHFILIEFISKIVSNYLYQCCK